MSENTPVDLFGGNSDGGMRMWEWLEVMCKGCKHESVKAREDGTGPGVGCRIADGACFDPYKFEVPEWSPDAVRPERLAELGDNPWPVCMAYEPRAERSDKGLRRGPRPAEGQGELFERAVMAS